MNGPRDAARRDQLLVGRAGQQRLSGAHAARGAIHAGWAIAVGIFVAVVICLLIFNRGTTAAPPDPATGSPSPRPAEVVVSDIIDSGVPERLTAAQPPDADRAPGESARQVIQREFGPQAADAIRKLEAKGWDLDRLGPPQLTWEDARMKLEARLMPTEAEDKAWLETVMAWPEQLTGLWIREHFSLGDRVIEQADVDAIESLVAGELEQGRGIAADMAQLRRLTLKRVWDQGRFTHRPFVILKEQRKNAFYAKSDLEGGWAYGLFLEWDDCPGLFDMFREAQMLALRRDERVREYLSRHR